MAYVKAIRENPMLAANTHIRSYTTYGIWSPRDGTAFAAAENAVVFEWTGEEVKIHKMPPSKYTPPGVDFYDIFGFSHDDVYAVGTFGAIWRYDGKIWQEIESPTKEWLEGIWGRSPNDLYVAGDEGTIFHWNGTDWKQIITNITARFYCIIGDDEVVYVTGSQGTVIKIVNDQATILSTGLKGDLIGIQKIPNSQKFLICGAKGVLVQLEDDKFTTLDSKTTESLYGLDTFEDKIVVVGWKGAGLYYDGKDWLSLNLGANSFLEGIVYAGNGKWISSGWYGRIVEFDHNTKVWRSLYQGRCEDISSISVNDKCEVVAASDSGSYLTKLISENSIALKYSNAENLKVALPPNEDSFLLFGENGLKTKISSSERDTSLVLSSAPDEKFCAACYCSNFTLLTTSQGKIYKLSKQRDGENFTLATDKVALPQDTIIEEIAAADENILYIQLKNKTDEKRSLVKLNVQNNQFDTIPYQDDRTMLFGSGKNIFVASKTKLYRLGVSDDGSPKEIFDFKTSFVYEKDSLSAVTLVDDSGLCYLGAKSGCVYIFKEGENIKFFRTGSCRAVSSINGNKKLIAVGYKGGRINLIEATTGKVIATESISAPHFRGACRYAGGFIFCGEMGIIGLFKDGSNDAEILSNGINDYYTALKICLQDKETICCAGVEQISLVENGEITASYPLRNIFIKSLWFDHDKTLYFGTDDGRILSCKVIVNEKISLNIGEINTVYNDLGAGVVSFSRVGDDFRIILEDGRVYVNATDKPAYHFAEQELKAPSVPEETEIFHVAGSPSFFCEITKEKTETIELPDKISSITAHGAIGPGDYWVGGSSGTLFLYKDKQFYKVHTGIGNQLFAIAEGGGRIFLCGAYTALRFENTDYIIKALEKPKENN